MSISSRFQPTRSRTIDAERHTPPTATTNRNDDRVSVDAVQWRLAAQLTANLSRREVAHLLKRLVQ
eukprot:1733461-Prymnesium_polylepis.1